MPRREVSGANARGLAQTDHPTAATRELAAQARDELVTYLPTGEQVRGHGVRFFRLDRHNFRYQYLLEVLRMAP
jgi:hypothetical protein